MNFNKRQTLFFSRGTKLLSWQFYRFLFFFFCYCFSLDYSLNHRSANIKKQIYKTKLPHKHFDLSKHMFLFHLDELRKKNKNNKLHGFGYLRIL